METATVPTKKKPGPYARAKAREAAAAAPLQEKPPKPNRPPRVSKFVDRPFSEELHVPLTPLDFTNKTHILLKMYREREGIEAESDTSKANFKQRLKSKDEEIIELQNELQTGTEKRTVPLIARYYPGEKRKVILDPGQKNKKVRDEPMTPAECREVSASQPELLPVAAAAAPAPVQATPAAPEGFADSHTLFGAPKAPANDSASFSPGDPNQTAAPTGDTEHSLFNGED